MTTTLIQITIDGKQESTYYCNDSQIPIKGDFVQYTNAQFNDSKTLKVIDKLYHISGNSIHFVELFCVVDTPKKTEVHNFYGVC